MMLSEPVQFWQYFDIIGIALVSFVVPWLMLTHRKKKGELLASISQTIAADSRSSLIFSVMMTVAVPLYYCCMWFWVGPKVAAPWYFYLMLAVSFVAEMIFVWVPATSGRSKLVHEVNASFVGLTMFLAPLALLVGGGLSDAARTATIIFIGVTWAGGGLLLTPKQSKYTLTYEIIYCVLFWALMLFIAHS